MRKQTGTWGALGLIAVGAAALAGCSGVGVGGTDSVRVRVVDAATNAGTVNMLVNNSSGYGDLVNPPTTEIGNVSPYLYAGTGKSTFSYTSTAVPATLAPNTTTNGTVATTSPAIKNSALLASGKFYSAFLVGRSDVAVTDPKFLHVLITDDARTTPADGASLRIINAAPDAGAIDVLVNGSSPNAAFSNLAYQIAQDAFLSAPYVTVPAGTLTVKVNAAGTQNALSAATSTSVTTTAGRAYTLVVTEPAASTTQPTYALQLVPDVNA